jgi:para-aminobenzoate synthetase component 1
MDFPPGAIGVLLNSAVLYPVNSAFIAHPDWKDHAAVLMTDEHTERELIALGASSTFEVSGSYSDPLNALREWLEADRTWIFGVLGYDLKNSIERLNPRHTPDDETPVISLFRPLVVMERIAGKARVIHNESKWTEAQLVSACEAPVAHAGPEQSVYLVGHITRETYLSDVRALQRHIQLGDIYEVNYCQEFSARAELISPFGLWNTLLASTRAPRAGYYQSGTQHLLSASPERFLKKTGTRLIAQPIKGTIRRGLSEEEDRELRETLYHNPKERSENVMIVDLVRNDLSRSALPGSVRVEELFGIHTFNTVHHMVSTVTAEVPADIPFTQLIRHSFPMGSMTGAPKVEAMKLIDQYEHSSRGWYSGSLGYITPHGDFDFNVIIRSMHYRAHKSLITCSVGSAITIGANPEKEYEECLLKLEAIQSVLLG